ncbi:MAG: Ldh family oxidoreductase [Chloroflexi bacterium]|nr:Ldh family oxidoreductase [Chloroflexota bacterium]
MPVVQSSDLNDFIVRMFLAVGSPEHDARELAAHLVDSNLAGHDSHGVIRAPQYLGQIETGLIVPGATSEVVRETETTTLLRGNWNYGQVVGREAMDLAIEKARAGGIGITVAWEISHTGRMGIYGEQAARAGMLAIAVVQGQGRSVAPFGGATGRLGTNPIVVAAPTPDPEQPFVLDMATSVTAGGKVKVADAAGYQLPPDSVLDAEGRPTRDPSAIEAGGAILPLGGPAGHKGFGLSLAVTALAGALAPQARLGKHTGSATTMIAVDIERFREPTEYASVFGAFLDYVRETPRQEGVEEIVAPGELERRNRERRRRDGIDLDDGTWQRLADAAVQTGIEPLPGMGGA